MNYRIKEIQIEAGIDTNLNNPEYFEKDMNKWVDCFAKRFAELIIKECIMICEKVEQVDNVKIRAGAYFCREDIREHFGLNDE